MREGTPGPAGCIGRPSHSGDPPHPMSSYPGGLAAFSVKADVDDEILDLAGQRLQLSSSASLLVERPNHFHAHRQGPMADMEVVFDGQTLTLHVKRLQIDAQLEAPGTIDEAVTELRAVTCGLPYGRDLRHLPLQLRRELLSVLTVHATRWSTSIDRMPFALPGGPCRRGGGAGGPNRGRRSRFPQAGDVLNRHPEPS
jgi:hypothetical protein